MKGHKFFMEGIPDELWKEFRKACIHFNTTAKYYFIACMFSFVKGYHDATGQETPEKITGDLEVHSP